MGKKCHDRRGLRKLADATGCWLERNLVIQVGGK